MFPLLCATELDVDAGFDGTDVVVEREVLRVEVLTLQERPRLLASATWAE